MKDQSKTKQALVQELASLRRRVADLEKMEADKDVIIHRDAEKALSESEELYRTLVETSPDAILMYALDGTILTVNNQLVVRYGAASAAEFHAEVKTVFDLLDELDQTTTSANFRRTMIQGGSRKIEYRVRLRDGQSISVETNSSVVRTADGKPRAFISVVRDITDRKQMEKILHDNKERYRNIFENANEAIFVAQDGRLVFLNPMTAMMSGYSAEDLMSKPFIEFIHPNDRDMVIDRHIRRMKGEKISHRYAFRIINRDGDSKWMELNAVLINWEGRAATLNFMSDITDRKRMEEALREGEERFRSLIQSLSDMIFIIDLSGQITYESPSVSRILGYEPGYFISKSPFIHIHPDDLDQVAKELDEVFRSVNPGLPTALRYQKADNTWIYLEALGSNHYDNPGIHGVVITARDITERKWADAALRKSEAEKTVILESVSDMILYIDRDMRVIYSNLAMEKFFNLHTGCLVGKACHHALHHLDTPCSICPAIIAMETGKPHGVFTSSLGRHWRLNAYPVRDESGTIVGAIEAVSDITDLRNAEEKYRSIFNNAMEGIYQSTCDGRLISVNPALAKIFGYESPEIMMSEVTNVMQSLYADPEKRQEFMRLVEQHEIVRNFEFEGLKKDSERIYVSDTARAVKDSKGNTIYYEGIIQDITERKRSVEALQLSEERFRALSENAPDIIYTMNPDGAISYVNPSWKRILGHDKEEIRGFYFTDFAREEDRRTYRKLFKSIRDEGKIVSNYIGIMMTKDGAEKVFNMNSAFNRDAEGRIISVVGTMTDVTDQKEIEKKLQQAQKLEAIGTLAGGIAHDFNNLLMGIQGYASLTLLDLEPSHPHYTRLKQIEQQVQSGADLTKQLLGFARGGRYEAKPTDMNEIVDRTAAMFGRTKKEIALQRSLDKDLWTVDVDQGQMEQVFMNLYVNAWQAMPGGGVLYLQTINFLLEGDRLMSHTIMPGRYVKVSITDTGSGMDEKTRERIFDPFFTTKAMGRGTGLGLAMVYGIIKGHGGMIDVTSEPGQGTTFDIYLPAMDKPIDKGKSVAVEILTGTETVLLVDDEQMVLEVTKELLESLGYRVHAAGSGQEAIAVYLEKRKEIDLVILDMTMPGLSGGETFDRLREIDPEIRVLLSSGYSIDGQAQQILERGCNGFLQKPFQLGRLSQKVRDVLSEEGT